MNNLKTGEIVRQMRLRKGLSQENVALELGISQASYSKIESDETTISLYRICELARILNVHPSELVPPELTYRRPPIMINLMLLQHGAGALPFLINGL